MLKRSFPIILIALFLLSCTDDPESNSNITAFVGATIIDGNEGAPIPNGVMLMENGRIKAVGTAKATKVPNGSRVVNLEGKFIMPGLINAHGHIGGTEGLQGGRYSKENVERDLALNARYGVTTIVSLGGDGQPSIDLRNTQNNDSLNRSRLFVAGTIVTGDSPEAVRTVVTQNAANKTDFIKIRVDDNLGNTQKMSPEVYAAVIDEAHKNGIPVASHLFYLADAKGLLNAGTDFIAHSIRDQLVDQELIDLIKAKDVYYCPTLMREVSTFVYESEPDFFSDFFFLGETDPEIITALKSPERQQRIQNSASAKAYRQALVIAKQNLKILSDNGVKIVMGTDAGPPARFQGYFEHKELELMVEAGLTPTQVIAAATGNSAKYLGLEEIGSLEKGKWADFLILDSNPLDDIRNTQRIQSVWIAGNQIPLK